MAKKSLDNVKKVFAKSESISFEFNGKDYREEFNHNLVVETLIPEDIKNVLNKTPSKYAYWSSIKSDIKKELNDLEVIYNQWFAEKYSKQPEKLTETNKKYNVILENTEYVKNYFRKKNNLILASDKVSALVEAYEIQSHTLQSISSLTRGEMQKLGMSDSGHGSFDDDAR